MKVLIYHAKQCNPNACTANKLKKFGLAELFYTAKKMPKGGVVLSPFSKKVLSLEDDRHLKAGITALDCSWKHAIDVFSSIKMPLAQRTLPLLVAANPVNYGKVAKLTTAEALSSALYILGKRDQAEEILSKFKWGKSFTDLNKDLLESYSKGRTEKEMIKIQEEYFGGR